MKNLKRKILTILISVFTTVVISVLLIANINTYQRERSRKLEAVFRMESSFGRVFANDNRKQFIMGESAYLVILNRDGEIEDIFGDTENLKITAKEIKVDSGRFLALYFDDYYVSMRRNNQLIVIDNSFTKQYLVNTFIGSIFIFVIMEAIFIHLSFMIARWIVVPVYDAFEKQKRFIYDASHELKTPIAIIRASVESLDGDNFDQNLIENIKSENERMNKLVSDLLYLSKTEDGALSLEKKNIDLSTLVKKQSLLFDSIVYENGKTLELDIDSGVMLSCDPAKIKELLNILIDNAIKYSYKKSEIKVSLKTQKNAIRLEVCNRGKEIPQDERERIFDRFYRADKSRNRNSNSHGIGLSIAKNIVIAHNGRIFVDSACSYNTFVIIFKK